MYLTTEKKVDDKVLLGEQKYIIFLMKMFKKKVIYFNCMLMFCLYHCHYNKMLSLNYYRIYRGNIPDILD